MKITAAVVRQKSGPFLLEEVELDEPKENEVLVRVVACGVCHTDLFCRDQNYPVPLPCVFGHEGSGIVEKVGAKVKKVKPGDHVVASFLSCGVCGPCKRGLPGYCLNFYKYNFSGGRGDDGSQTMRKDNEIIYGAFFGQSTFATYALVEEANTVKVPNDVPLELLGPLGCGIQTGAGAVINALRPAAGSSIAIFGTGAVGLSAVMAAAASGCSTVIAIDINADRLELAKSLGATHSVNSKNENPVKAIQAITGGGVQYSLEAVGNASLLRQAVDCLALTGVAGLIGAAPMGTEVKIDMNSILFGRTLRGIIEGDSIPDIFIPQLIDLYKLGKFPLDKMVKYYKFSDINQAVEDSEKGRTLKAIVTM